MSKSSNQDPSNLNPQSTSSSAGGGTTMSDAQGILEVDQARKFAQAIGSSLLGDKCEHVVILDVTKTSPVTGFIVIGSGTSARQMRSALENLDDTAKEFNTKAFHISNDNDTLWLLADFVDVVVHVFEPNARAHYDLESMWPEAPMVEVPPFIPPSNKDAE
ncbi:MAG: ribosome silencing factor [Phycisphaerales bacterium]